MKSFIIVATVVAAFLLRQSSDALNICTDTGCFCDNITPYLIQCSEINLKTLYSPEDWQETIEKQNISDVELDVRFDSNYLEEIPAFPTLKIVSLSFQNNRLHKIENYAFKDLDDLQSLDLSQNEFTAKDLPEFVFGGKWNDSEYQPLGLLHLNMSSNRIHTVEQDLFDHLPSLTSLDLSHNPLRILGTATASSLAQLMNLKYLNLAYTEISSIPLGMIHNFLDLESLDLSGNKFKEVPKEILETHNLKVLTLDGNQFEKFDEESFAGLTTVEELSISYMDTLRLIEERAFGTMFNLTRFYCHHNRNLNRINNAAFYEIAVKPEDWPVKEMYLNDNGLTHIDKALAGWVMVQKVNIQNNPFRCDCDLKWMAEVLVQQITRSSPELALNLVCAEPKDRKGNSIVELGMEPETFYKCRAHLLNGERYEMDPEIKRQDSYHQGVAITILVIGVILIVIGLSILSVIVVKRRAIASALIAHQQIRYQRAEDDEIEHDAYKTPASVYRVA